MELSGTKRWEKIDRKFQKVKPMLFDYDGLIKKILLSTEGKWQRDEKLPSENWYFTIGRFMVR